MLGSFLPPVPTPSLTTHSTSSPSTHLLNKSWVKFEYSFRYKSINKPGVVAYGSSPRIQIAETGGIGVWGQPRLYSDTLSQKQSI
jgi:hypothetical protein